MQSQIIEVAGGVTTKGHYDEHTDTLIVQRTADVTANIEQNKRLYNANYHQTFTGDMHEVADIPCEIFDQWCREDGVNYLQPEHAQALKRKLNDPDNRFLRTMPGKL